MPIVNDQARRFLRIKFLAKIIRTIPVKTDVANAAESTKIGK